MIKLQFDILTLFPDMFPGYLNKSIMGRAQQKGLIKINIHDIRKYAVDKHRITDEKPYGGGPGMVLKVEPIYRNLKQIISRSKVGSKFRKIIILSPQGKKFDQAMAKKYTKLKHIVLIAGRYEGLDERINKLVDEQISIGDYVLTGGELPAMVMIDAIARLVPGVVGKEISLAEETFARKGFIEYPQYTRPDKFQYVDWQGIKKTASVPRVLLSGDHKKIKIWREKHSKKR